MKLSNKISEVKRDFHNDSKLVDKSKLTIADLKNKFLGRKGLLNDIYIIFSHLPTNDKRKYGLIINDLKKEIQLFIDSFNQKKTQSANKESIDLTLPGKKYNIGSLHPITLIINEIKSIFERIGFSCTYGPEVDTDYFNFEALNIPAFHPARDMQDTFYINDSTLLRTHTSSSQIHYMLDNKPPIRVISPGKVYRNEDISVRSYCLFHQLE